MTSTAYLWKLTFRKCYWKGLTTIKEKEEEEIPPIPVLKRQNGYIVVNGKTFGDSETEEQTLLGKNEKNHYIILKEDEDYSKKK